MNELNSNDFRLIDLFKSIFIASFLGILLSHNLTFYLTEPLMRDQSLFIGSRYTITVDALDTIAGDEEISIVVIGSSMSYKAVDGLCISGGLEGTVKTYNLAQPASKPYTDMQHIPRIISSDPDIVMIEISPGIISTPSSDSSIEYLQLRYKLDTMYQSNSDLGGWVDIVPPEYIEWVAKSDYERAKFRQEYVPGAIEEHLLRAILNENSGREEGIFGWVPSPGHDDWENYLQTPIFPPDSYGLEGMTVEELEEYNASKLLESPWAEPASFGTLSHEALEYEINSLLNSGIQIVIITPAYHPRHLEFLTPGQWDGFNDTVAIYSEIEGITIFDQTWSQDTWNHDDFYDRNHLDGDGRLKYCQEISPILQELINNQVI